MTSTTAFCTHSRLDRITVETKSTEVIPATEMYPEVPIGTLLSHDEWKCSDCGLNLIPIIRGTKPPPDPRYVEELEEKIRLFCVLEQYKRYINGSETCPDHTDVEKALRLVEGLVFHVE